MRDGSARFGAQGSARRSSMLAPAAERGAPDGSRHAGGSTARHSTAHGTPQPPPTWDTAGTMTMPAPPSMTAALGQKARGSGLRSSSDCTAAMNSGVHCVVSIWARQRAGRGEAGGAAAGWWAG